MKIGEMFCDRHPGIHIVCGPCNPRGQDPPVGAVRIEGDPGYGWPEHNIGAPMPAIFERAAQLFAENAEKIAAA